MVLLIPPQSRNNLLLCLFLHLKMQKVGTQSTKMFELYQPYKFQTYFCQYVDFYL